MTARIKTASYKKMVFVVMMSFIVLYVGHFLFTVLNAAKKVGDERSPQEKNDGAHENVEVKTETKYPPVQHKQMTTVIHGNTQKVNILEVDPKSDRVAVRPMLSHDSIFGFETLSAMASRANAYAAVNAGFFHEYGQPSGMVVIDGSLVTGSTGRYPVLVIQDGKAYLKELETEIRLEKHQERMKIDGVNILQSLGKAVLYTDIFGTDNRAKARNTSLTIEDGIITKISRYEGAVKIPSGGRLLTLYDQSSSSGKEALNMFKEGDRVEVKYEPYLGDHAQAYECGSWIVKDGKVVIGEKDEWVGVMTNWDPRTAVGIKDDGTVVLMTVDGRQPGYSVGMTGRELGEFLLDYGVGNAAMLDGGASTEMIVEGKIVNKPSHKGQERPLAGAIIVYMK